MNIVSQIGFLLGNLGLIIAIVHYYFLKEPMPGFTGYLVYGGVFLALIGNLTGGKTASLDFLSVSNKTL